MRLAAGLRPDPLGELERSPDPLAAIGGGDLLLKGRGGGGEEGRKKRRAKGEAGREKGEGKGGDCLPFI